MSLTSPLWLRALPLTFAALAVPQVAVAAATDTATPAGTCAATASLPCSASGGQAYGGVVLGPDGADDERAVEAVLGQVIGTSVDVSRIAAAGGTRAGLHLDVDRLADTARFDWAYRGPESPAYVTVKTPRGFTLIGIGGQRSGSVDVGALVGRSAISHVGVWATHTSVGRLVRATRFHGPAFVTKSLLGRIENGTVPCMHVESFAMARCAFGPQARRATAWLEGPDGSFARAGQPISLSGRPGGEYVIAALMNPDGTAPGLNPVSYDSAGVGAAGEAALKCVLETSNSTKNVTGIKLRNVATLMVPSNVNPHPDGTLPSSAANGVWYYTGAGAALNDPYGTERDGNGHYLTTADACHVMAGGIGQIPAAKRPKTSGGTVLASDIAWRPVSGLKIANP